MRNTFTLLALLFTTTLSAQLKKGDWNINTSTNAPMNIRWRSNGPDYKTFDFGINPGVGYFIKDRWEVGGGPLVNVSGSKYKYPTGPFYQKVRNSSVGVHLFTRYYLKKEGRFIPYLTLNASYSKLYTCITDYNGVKNSYRTHQWQAGGGVGASWFISPKVALFGELTYTGDWGNGSGYNSGLNFKVGVQIFFNRKKKN